MDMTIKNIDAVTEDGVRRCNISIKGTEFSEETFSDIRDGSGLIAVPGFIDTHIHGIGGAGTEDKSADSILQMSSALAEAGVTTFFPTIYTDLEENMLDDIDAIVEAKGKEKGADIGGIHVEGPFISPDRIGAQNPLGRKDPDVSLMRRFIEHGKGLIKAMTCAPEAAGIDKIIPEAEASGIVLLMGHTSATYDEAVKGMEMGICHATHLFNAMTGLMHRAPGVVGCVLYHEKMNTEIIMDGFHVHPANIKAVIRIKGADKVVAITDSLKPTMQKSGRLTANGVEVEMGGGFWVTKGNTDLIQGSALTMHQAFINLLNWGIPITDAVKMTSTTPARIYSLSDRGRIAPGLRADMVVFDHDLRIISVIKEGEFICGTIN